MRPVFLVRLQPERFALTGALALLLLSTTEIARDERPLYIKLDQTANTRSFSTLRRERSLGKNPL